MRVFQPAAGLLALMVTCALDSRAFASIDLTGRWQLGSFDVTAGPPVRVDAVQSGNFVGFYGSQSPQSPVFAGFLSGNQFALELPNVGAFRASVFQNGNELRGTKLFVSPSPNIEPVSGIRCQCDDGNFVDGDG